MRREVDVSLGRTIWHGESMGPKLGAQYAESRECLGQLLKIFQRWPKRFGIYCINNVCISFRKSYEIYSYILLSLITWLLFPAWSLSSPPPKNLLHKWSPSSPPSENLLHKWSPSFPPSENLLQACRDVNNTAVNNAVMLLIRALLE